MSRLLFLLVLTTLGLNTYGQVCVPNTTYTQVGLYPQAMTDGTVGQAYSEVLHFVLPTDTMGYDFTNFEILSVSLPVGLEWECNNASNGCNYNPQVSVHGCGLVFGTPLVSGDYMVEVNVVADLTIVQGVPFSFEIPLTILPFELGNSNDGFSMTGAFACAPAMVSFTNNNPGLMAYSWDFGNGNSSNLENPGPQLYMNPGEYVVYYTAYSNMDTIYVYTLTSVSVNALSNYGGGFPGFDSPDPYFIIKENGQAIYQSPIVSGASFPNVWNVNITLDPANTYTIEVWEADESNTEILFGADDGMGQTTVNLNSCSGCVLAGGSGGGNVSYVVTNQTILPNPAVISSDTVVVNGFPDNPLVVYDANQNVMSTEDLGFVYQWYFNGDPIPGASSTTHIPAESGYYSVSAFSSGGCAASSVQVLGVVCTDYEPGIYSSQNEIILNNAMPNGTNQWFLNGVAIAGATGNSVTINGLGSYAVTVTDDFGCEYTSTSMTFTASIEQHATPTWSAYPNPAENKVNVQIHSSFLVKGLEISDMTGRVVYTMSTNKNQLQIDISDWPSGVYFVQLIGEHTMYTKKLVKR